LTSNDNKFNIKILIMINNHFYFLIIFSFTNYKATEININYFYLFPIFIYNKHWIFTSFINKKIYYIIIYPLRK